MKKIYTFDTTLRDGQQSPGAGMSKADNIKFAQMAAEAGVDVLEAGFPAASKMDFNIVNSISQQQTESDSSMVITGLAQLREEQIQKTIEAIQPSISVGKGRIHTYLPVDPRLFEASIGDIDSKGKFVGFTEKMCQIARESGAQVQFSLEGYSRIGDWFDFGTDLILAAIAGGATVINCPDTIGESHWLQGENYYVELMKRHKKIVDEFHPGNAIIWSVHNHNDYGYAVENSVKAVFDGVAQQVEGTINGVGERAGNATLEQFVMIMKRFGVQNGVKVGFDSTSLQEMSDFIKTKMLPRQPHWPVTGDNAARHASGGHTNAILKNWKVYQPFDPKNVGKDGIELVFSPLSGGNHAKSVIEKAGFVCEDSEKAEIAQFIKDMYPERRKGITNDELIAAYFEYRSPIKITQFNYFRENGYVEINLKGEFFGQEGVRASYDGKDSGLAALKKEIDKIMPGFKIQDYSSKADNEGYQAQSVSVIIIGDANVSYKGVGTDSDIEISAMKALIKAYNQAYVDKKFKVKK